MGLGRTLERIHHALYVEVREKAGREASPTTAIIDSQTAKGAVKGGLRSTRPGYDAGKKVLGRKRHVLTDTLGLLLAVNVHPASVQDRDGAEALLREAAQLPLRRAHHRRCRLSGAEDGSRRRPHRLLGASDRAPLRPAPLRRAAQTLDRGAHPRLDQPLSSAGPRLRAPRSKAAAFVRLAMIRPCPALA